jgi:hypothetical protein
MSSPATPLKGDCCRPDDDANEDNPHRLTGPEGPRERLAGLTVFGPLTTAYAGGGSPPSPSSPSRDRSDSLDDPDHLTGPEGPRERRAGLTVFGPLGTAYAGGGCFPSSSPPSRDPSESEHDPYRLMGPDGARERRAGLTVFSPLGTTYAGWGCPPSPSSFRDCSDLTPTARVQLVDGTAPADEAVPVDGSAPQ